MPKDVVGSTPSAAAPSNVPSWVKIFVALLMTVVFCVILILDAVLPEYGVPIGVYPLMGIVVGGLFGSAAKDAVVQKIKEKAHAHL